MATGQLGGLIQNLRRSAFSRDTDALADAELLNAFLAHTDDSAFEALVRRHSAMVWGVCLRALGHTQDAEDAFQATFLVLVRKANSVWPREMVGNWLYGVAHRTALKAKGLAARRKAREKQVDDMPAVEAHPEKTWSDLQPVLDRELHRLADKYRVPIVLCDLEGKSQREAARQLGWPEGTLTTRLTRGRKMLARRLSQRGLALSAGALALLLTQSAASASAPMPLLAITIKTATLVAAGQAASAAATASVAALAEGVIQAMVLSKIKSSLIVLASITLLLMGGGIVTHQVLANRGAGHDAQTPWTEPEVPDEFTLFQERGANDQRGRAGSASLAGKVIAVADDGKSFTVETPAVNRGEAPVKHVVRLTDKTKLTFFAVGTGGAKLVEGMTAQVWLAEGSKENAAAVSLTGTESNRRNPDITGKVVRLDKDSATVSIETLSRDRQPGKVVDIKIALCADMTFSGVAKGGAQPAAGYIAQVWLENGSKDAAASIHFAGVAAGERGRPAPRDGNGGKIVAVSKDGKMVTIETPPANRGEAPRRIQCVIDDKTEITFYNIPAGGDRLVDGYSARFTLVEDSDRKLAQLLLADNKERGTVLRSKVSEVAKDQKSFTIELPPMERGGASKALSIKISEKTRVIYMGVAAGGAQPTVGYHAEVHLEGGSNTDASQVTFIVDGGAGTGRR